MLKYKIVYIYINTYVCMLYVAYQYKYPDVANNKWLLMRNFSSIGLDYSGRQIVNNGHKRVSNN